MSRQSIESTTIATMFSFGSNKNPDDPTKHGSSAVDDDGTDETYPEENLFLDLCEDLHDEGAEETIEFNEVYGSAVPGSVEDGESYDPYIRYAYIRKIDGTDFVKKRRVSVLRRRRSVYGTAFVILLGMAAVIGFGIYNVVKIEIERKNNMVALGAYSGNHLIKDEYEDEEEDENDNIADHDNGADQDNRADQDFDV